MFNAAIFKTLMVALLGGIIGTMLHLPAGGLFGSMVTVALVNLFTKSMVSPPRYFRVGAQILIGSIIGSRITLQTFIELQDALVPAVVSVAILITGSILSSQLLIKTGSLDKTTALFSTSPGGMTDMSLMSMDFGADGEKVALLHFFRIVTVLLLSPILIGWIEHFM